MLIFFQIKTFLGRSYSADLRVIEKIGVCRRGAGLGPGALGGPGPGPGLENAGVDDVTRGPAPSPRCRAGGATSATGRNLNHQSALEFLV